MRRKGDVDTDEVDGEYGMGTVSDEESGAGAVGRGP
jgi:hypothetical protein